jgi:hypothetical protein
MFSDMISSNNSNDYNNQPSVIVLPEPVIDSISATVPSEPVTAATSPLKEEMLPNIFDLVINSRVLPQVALQHCKRLLEMTAHTAVSVESSEFVASVASVASVTSVVAAWIDFLRPKRASRYSGYTGYIDEYVADEYVADEYVADEYVADEYANGYDDSSSFMAKNFHPAPQADSMWIQSMKRDADWIENKCKMKNTLPDSTISSLNAQLVLDFLEEAKIMIGATGIEGYVLTSDKKEESRVAAAKKHSDKKQGSKSNRFNPVETKIRKTCRAQFTLKPHAELVGLGSTLSYYPDYVRALKFVSKLQGRVHTWFEPWITANSLRLAKSGLITFYAKEIAEEIAGSIDEFQRKYPITTVTVSMMVSEWGARKEFTLESQKQGALNEYLIQLLELAKLSEPNALKIIALIYPDPDIYNLISKEACSDIYDKWISWAKHLALFLDDQWNKGVWKSARRQMRVLPRGSPVNSSGYNAAADAWSNMCRFVRVAVFVGEIKDAPLLLKTLQLIANDQFEWGQAAGKGVHSDAAVFDSLTRRTRSNVSEVSEVSEVVDGILPWNAILNPSKFDTTTVLTRLSKACEINGVSLDAWLGLPKVRTELTRTHVDMICGCKVPQMSKETADWLKSLGLFGAGMWK